VSIWQQIAAILWRDLAIEIRTKETLSTMLLFALIVLVIFNFAFQLRMDNIKEAAPGVLWVGFTFAGILGLGRSLSRDQEQGTLEGLMLSPVDGGTIYLGKMLANLTIMVAVEAVMLPLFVALFDLSLAYWPLVLILPLGTVGFVAMGTLIAAMAVNTRAREALLPVLLFPAVVPMLLAAVKATGQVLDGQGWGGIGHWIRLLIAYDVIALVLAYLTFDYVVEQ